MRKSLLLLLIMIFAGVGSISAKTERRYYLPESFPADSVLEFIPNANEVAIEARCALTKTKEESGPGKHWWGIAWNNDSCDGYNYVILRPTNLDYGSINDSRVVTVEYGICADRANTIISSANISSGINAANGDNTLLLEWSDGDLRVSAGSKTLNCHIVANAKLPASPFKLISSDKIIVISIVTESVIANDVEVLTDYNESEVMSRIAASVDMTEGLWHYLDRETDDSWARPGGGYSLVIVATDGGCYDILYLSGARVNRDRWKPMMLKGRLTPTPFIRHYNLTWYDAMMEPITEECSATISDEGIITFEFPLYKSRMRFYRDVSAIR